LEESVELYDGLCSPTWHPPEERGRGVQPCIGNATGENLGDFGNKPDEIYHPPSRFLEILKMEFWESRRQ